METLEEKKSSKLENNKQTLLIVMVIFIVLLAFLAGVLTSLLIMEKADHSNEKNDTVQSIETTVEGENSFVTHEDLEKMKEEIMEETIDQIMEEAKNETMKESMKEALEEMNADLNTETDSDESISDKTDADKTSADKINENKSDGKSHRYELIVEDITWTEAEQSCKDKGGYLATITSKEEFESLTKQIVDEKKTKISFFIGATRDENYVNHSSGVIAYHWVHDGSDIDLYDEETKEFWLADEPSFYGRKADGSKLDEQYVDMIYREADKRCYFNDVADDILAQVPSFSGSVGYICEYDE